MSGNLGNDGRKSKPFRWSATKLSAAELLGIDELTDEQIGERLGIPRSTLHNWKQHAEFNAKTESFASAFAARIRKTGICNRTNRLRALQDRWNRMNRVIHQRAADPKMKDVAGGDTGLMVHNVKSIGGGENGPKRVDLYEVDTALLKELRDHEKQVAQEVGDWTDKQDLTSNGKTLAVKILRGVSMDDL